MISVLARNDDIDLAVLAVANLVADPVKIAKVDRARADLLREVTAVGFPNYKYAEDRPIYQSRQPAQPSGSVPMLENFSTGNLVLKLEAGEPAPGESGADSPWAGMSGAGVFVGDYLLGVVIEHHMADGLGVLHFAPLTLIESLPVPSATLFAAVLGISDWGALAVANAAPTIDGIDAALVQDLKEIKELLRQGLLESPDATTLRIMAMKKFKGYE